MIVPQPRDCLRLPVSGNRPPLGCTESRRPGDEKDFPERKIYGCPARIRRKSVWLVNPPSSTWFVVEEVGAFV
jgi:hypothetical protein